MAEGDQSGKVLSRCSLSAKTPGLERERSPKIGKGKARVPLFPASRPSPLVNLSALGPRLAGGWLDVGHALLFLLGLWQERRIVGEVLKIGMNQQPCGFNQLRRWLGCHHNPLDERLSILSLGTRISESRRPLVLCSRLTTGSALSKHFCWSLESLRCHAAAAVNSKET